jgi:hypothetical protein
MADDIITLSLYASYILKMSIISGNNGLANANCSRQTTYRYDTGKLVEAYFLISSSDIRKRRAID